MSHKLKWSRWIYCETVRKKMNLKLTLYRVLQILYKQCLFRATQFLTICCVYVYFYSRSSRSQEFKWKKEEKLHVVNKIDDDTEQPHRKISYSSVSDNSDSEVLALPPPSHSITEKNKRRTQKKKNKTRFCMSTSSADESDGNFSSEIWDEEDEETETLVSSCRSLEYSTDSSSDLNQQLETIYETTKTRRQKRTIGSSKRRPVKHSKRSVSRGMNMGNA